MMRRGFKKEAAVLAADVRDELGLTPLDRLDPWSLADHLDIPVVELTSYGQAEFVDILLGEASGAFSAMLVFVGMRRTLIHNDGHAPARQRANLSHELAHALLQHQPHGPLDGRTPYFDAAQEDEAAWLGGVLLVPDEFCLQRSRLQTPLAEAAGQMGVSNQLMRWRHNMSGAERRVARAAAF